MIKSEETSLERSASKRGSSPCWQREPNCLGLRVEFRDGSEMMFPYSNLCHASLATGDKDDVISITFASHEVTIRGRGLHKLLVVLQKQAVEWVRPMPPGWRHRAGDGAGWIGSLQVAETDEGTSRMRYRSEA